MTKVRPLRAFAATGCALLADCSRTQGGGEIQRRGEFDPRWLCNVLMAVASVLPDFSPDAEQAMPLGGV